MTATKRQPPEHKPSFLLTKDENERLFRLIGTRCKSMASAVVQVHFSDMPYHTQWIKWHCGVLCFIKDNVKRSYFMRVYCPERQILLWEHELYNQFEYNAPRSYFHTFEGDDCQIGFNFADEVEAEFYYAVIKDNLRQKLEKRERRRAQLAQHQQQQQQQQQQPQSLKHQPASSATNGSINSTSAYTPAAPLPAPAFSISVSKKNKKEKKKLTKADIGLPSNFQHVSHVGWDPNKGFALENVDPQLLQFFARAGVSESHLQDKATRDFIYDFIDKHGGMEAAIREVATGSLFPPPVPARNPPSTPQSTRTAPPAPPVAPQAAVPPPPPSRIIASPPVAPPAPRAPPAVKSAPPAIPQNTSNIPPPPPMNSIPPPPPMMELAPAHMQPAPPPMPQAAPVPNDPHNALLDAIKGGSKLKPVDSEQRPKPIVDTRHDLLSEIRSGVALKPVENEARKSNAQLNDDVMDGMAGALQRALRDRSRVIHSDSEDSEEDEEDDDWDD